MSDLISRADAIEFITNLMDRGCAPCDYTEHDRIAVICYQAAINALSALPSAEATCATCADRALCIMSAPDGNWKACKDYRSEAVQGWIPCSEKLPSEKDGRVLVTKRDEVKTAIYSEFSGRWYLGDMCAVGGENPIAWMPLPKPWREDGEA